ncbi:MAG: ATP-binding cassette domain-containing protein, partial [Armatimonadetes bacterium]|nr:ATP-binding cassette domain-containing protein [Armatimonadota bacterium]
MAGVETTSLGDVVIKCENLTKTYRNGVEDLLRLPGVTALHNLSMEVHRGEVFAMIGPNGSGKTTTLKLLMGLIFPSRGTCRLFGRNPKTDVSVKRRIGFMPDGPYFYGHLNGYELLEFYGSLLGIDPQTRKRRVPELVDMVGMSNRARQRVRTYSKGMVQRIGLAHAMLNDPEIVFMDEPTSGLDPIGARDIRSVIRRMKEQGKTVFLCSHFLTEIEGLCDRVILLDRGRTLRYGTLEDFQAFLGEAHRRGLRVITELVCNHTSDQHPWFGKARRARPGTVARNRYVWSDTPDRYRDARIIFTDTEP